MNKEEQKNTTQPTPTPEQPPQEKPKKEKKTKKKKEKSPIKNLNVGMGINLIPPKTDEEIKVETTKSRLNISAAVAVLILVLITLGIFGFNIFSTLNLNIQKESLGVLENQLNGRTSVIDSNNELLSRIDLYEEIKESTYSNKEVIDYWDKVITEYGNFTSVDLTGGLAFSVTGSSSTLTDVSKLWYILGNDPKVEFVNLKSVNKGDSNVRFIFEGKLNFDSFKST
jgi:hypothetical protein